MNRFDEAEAAGRCECGVSLKRHKPLPKAGPFPSWRTERETPDVIRRRAATWSFKSRIKDPVVVPRRAA